MFQISSAALLVAMSDPEKYRVMIADMDQRRPIAEAAATAAEFAHSAAIEAREKFIAARTEAPDLPRKREAEKAHLGTVVRWMELVDEAQAERTAADAAVAKFAKSLAELNAAVGK